MKLDRGYLIVFEGIDGAGKSTQAGILHEYLKNKGLDALLSREPTDSEYGLKIRQLAQSGREATSAGEEYDLFIRDRKLHCKNLLRPALADRRIIVLDRYYLSTMAYQGAIGLDPQRIKAENEAFCPIPDIVFIVTIDPGAGIKRIQHGRKEIPNLFEQEENLMKVKRIFDAMEDAFIVRINGEDDVDSIHHQVVETVNTLIST